MVDSLLQDTTALTKRADELREASAADVKAGREKIAKSSSGFAKAGLSLAASSDKRIKSFGLGMAAAGAVKNASKREKALAELTAKAEEDATKIKTFKAQVEKNEQTKKNLSGVAPSVVEGVALFKQQGRAGNAQDQAGLDKTITGAITASDPEGFAGISATWNDAANQALIAKADGTEGVIGLNEMLDLIQNEELKTFLSRQVLGTSTALAQQEAEAKVAKAEAIANLAQDANKDTRVGLGLDSLTQKTQAVAGGFEEAAQKNLVENYANRLSTVSTDAATARGQQAPLDLLVNNVDTANTGAAATYLRAIDSTLKQAGFDAGFDPNGDLSQVATASEEFIKPYIEAQGKGFTDVDRKAVERSIAGIGNSKEANRAFVTFANVNNKLKIQKQRIINDMAQQGRANEIPSVLDAFEAQSGRTVISAINFVKNNRDVSLKDLMSKVDGKLAGGE